MIGQIAGHVEPLPPTVVIGTVRKIGTCQVGRSHWPAVVVSYYGGASLWACQVIDGHWAWRLLRKSRDVEDAARGIKITPILRTLEPNQMKREIVRPY